MFPTCTLRLKYHVDGQTPGRYLVDWAYRESGCGDWGTGILSLIAYVELC